MTGKRQDDTPPATPTRGATSAAGADAPLSDEAVAAFLKQNPDFLRRRPEVLDALQPPRRHHGDGVTDLQQAMVERARSELAKIRESRDDLIQTGRANMNTQSRTHKAVLALLGAKSFEHLIETTTTDVSVMLDLDAVTICVEQTEDAPAATSKRGVLQMEPGTVDRLLGQERDHLLVADMTGASGVFGEASELIRSAALMRLDIPGAPPALLAMGTRTPGTFEPHQGTELLHFLANVLALAIRRWLELPS